MQMAPSAAEMARQVKILTALQTAGPTATNFADTRGFTASGGSSAGATPPGLCYRRCGGTALLQQAGLGLSRVLKNLGSCSAKGGLWDSILVDPWLCHPCSSSKLF